MLQEAACLSEASSVACGALCVATAGLSPPYELKTGSWRAMHSYVHGGIRPVLQSWVDAPELTAHALAGVIINANGMLAMATNLVRMSSGIRTPQLLEIQKRHAACLPPS